MIAQASLFLLDVLTAFLTVALLLRFYMQACRVSFNNQIGTFVVELTNWLVRPLRKVLPGWYGSIWRVSCRPTCCRSVSFWRCSCCAAVPKAGRSRPGCRCCSGAACWPPCASASTS
ncbi:MAG: YggT family protein [Candidatus Accumulibacter necessarius]|uniref:YggT family protein n=1 Tax=Candidatus Accumulibacter necessarius TaxID=2954386 RepID=UPI002FC31902